MIEIAGLPFGLSAISPYELITRILYQNNKMIFYFEKHIFFITGKFYQIFNSQVVYFVAQRLVL